jgi:hypothetical protein
MTIRTLNPSRLAPLASLAALLLLSRWLPNRVQADERTEQRRTEIRQTMERLPFFVGDRWVGEDLLALLAPEAQELLRPNAIFNRRYEQGRQRWVHVLIVHCSDARDMIGHYPPVCGTSPISTGNRSAWPSRSRASRSFRSSRPSASPRTRPAPPPARCSAAWRTCSASWA